MLGEGGDHTCTVFLDLGAVSSGDVCQGYSCQGKAALIARKEVSLGDPVKLSKALHDECIPCLLEICEDLVGVGQCDPMGGDKLPDRFPEKVG